MTETVQVPLDLLNNLKASVRGRTNDGWLQETYVTGKSVDELIALIPDPIKVGDKITGVQFASLPPLSVAIDSDGDVWVRTEDEYASLIAKDGDYVTTEEGTYIASDIGNGTVVHIGREVN